MREPHAVKYGPKPGQAAAEQAGNTRLQVHDCGLVEYRKVLRLQHELRDRRRRDEIPDTVLLVEHPSVITLGARRSSNKLLVSPERLADNRVDLVEVRRGGGTTAHNPGQLVLYPILDLQQLGLGAGQYVRKLEDTAAELLDGLGLRSTRRKGFPGLWVCGRKIASIGVRVSKFVTYHGMAINIRNDLRIFDLITPCGLDGVEMTSVLEETGVEHSMSRIKTDLAGLLTRNFSSGAN